jgi:hypothetical protein
MFNLSTRGVVASFAAAAYLSLLPFIARTAEKPVVPQFKNVDEAIGWVKAKGKCGKIGKEQQGSQCEIKLDLPDEKVPEVKGESVWQRWAYMRSFDLELYRTFTISIVRSKHFLLSANDPRTTVRSVRVSNYQFDRSGKVDEVSVDSFIENFKGEKILRQTIPIPLDSIHKHGDGGYDLVLFSTHLGVGWKYY